MLLEVIRMAKKLTIDVVKKRVKTKSPNTIILSDEYVNAKTKMKCKCKKCGFEWSSIWDSLRRGKGCPECAGNQLNTIQRVEKYVLENSECELLSQDYKNAKQKLLFRCLCGNEFERNFNDFKNKKRNCPTCSYKNTGMINAATDEEIKNVAHSRGHVLLKRFSDKHFTKVDLMDGKGYKYRLVYTDYKQNNIGVIFGGKNFFYKENIRNFFKRNAPEFDLEEVYNGKHGSCVTFICDKGHRESKFFYNFRRGVRCRTCFYENNIGENHPRFKPELTNEDRISNRYLLYGKSQRKWSRSVHEKNNFKCVICGSNKNIEAHHLDSWNSAEEKRFDVKNGVTLCKSCHKEFHKKYGYGYNTKEQFIEHKQKLLLNTH